MKKIKELFIILFIMISNPFINAQDILESFTVDKPGIIKDSHLGPFEWAHRSNILAFYSFDSDGKLDLVLVDAEKRTVIRRYALSNIPGSNKENVDRSYHDIAWLSDDSGIMIEYVDTPALDDPWLAESHFIILKIEDGKFDTTNDFVQPYHMGYGINLFAFDSSGQYIASDYYVPECDGECAVVDKSGNLVWRFGYYWNGAIFEGWIGDDIIVRTYLPLDKIMNDKMDYSNSNCPEREFWTERLWIVDVPTGFTKLWDGWAPDITNTSFDGRYYLKVVNVEGDTHLIIY